MSEHCYWLSNTWHTGCNTTTMQWTPSKCGPWKFLGDHRRSSEIIGDHRRSSQPPPAGLQKVIIGDHRRSLEIIGDHRRSSAQGLGCEITICCASIPKGGTSWPYSNITTSKARLHLCLQLCLGNNYPHHTLCMHHPCITGDMRQRGGGYSE